MPTKPTRGEKLSDLICEIGFNAFVGRWSDDEECVVVDLYGGPMLAEAILSPKGDTYIIYDRLNGGGRGYKKVTRRTFLANLRKQTCN